MSSKDKTQKKLLPKTYRFAFAIFIIFAITALISVFIGNIVDEKLDIEPIGSITTLLVSYAITWIVAFILIRRFKKSNESKS